MEEQEVRRTFIGEITEVSAGMVVAIGRFVGKRKVGAFQSATQAFHIDAPTLELIVDGDSSGELDLEPGMVGTIKATREGEGAEQVYTAYRIVAEFVGDEADEDRDDVELLPPISPSPDQVAHLGELEVDQIEVDLGAIEQPQDEG